MPRIVSLVPGATEIVCALGFEADLVGRSHSCDYPPSIQHLPAVTEPALDLTGSSREIDQRLQTVLRDGGSVWQVRDAALAELKPDILLTQFMCALGTVSPDEARRAAGDSQTAAPELISLTGKTTEGIAADIQRVAEKLRIPERGDRLIAELRQRMNRVVEQADALPEKPTVALVEWIDPLVAAGNWLPELVEMAGGVPLFGAAGQPSPWLEWDELWASDPDRIIILPCGFDIQRAGAEMPALARQPGWTTLRAVRDGHIYLTDSSQFFNRPGPRLVESLEILAEILHPDAFHLGHEGTGWTRYRE